MKILYVSQYFYPEVGATTNRAMANIRLLADHGHDVTVLTEMPNHPKGIIFDDYKGKVFLTEQIESFKVNRVWIYTNPKKTFVTRMLFYLSFQFMAIIHTIFSWKHYDLIYVTSPPLFVGIIGIALKKLYPKTNFIFELRDLWPAAAIEMGELQNKKMISFSYKLEHTLYNIADHIIAVTERFKQNIVERGFDAEKISVVRNGSDLEFKQVTVPEKFKESLNIGNRFIVLYAGNLGIAQNLTTILKTAEIMQDKDVTFLMVGSGPEEKQLQEYADNAGLENVIFTGLIPKSEMNQFLSIADCGLIPLKNITVFERTIPSKLFDYMSANLPILLGVKGEALEILEEAQAGIGFEPDDHIDLAKKINMLYQNKEMLNEMKSRGREFVIQNYDRKKLAEKLEGIILKVCQ